MIEKQNPKKRRKIYKQWRDMRILQYRERREHVFKYASAIRNIKLKYPLHWHMIYWYYILNHQSFDFMKQEYHKYMILVFFEWLLIWNFIGKRQKSLFIYLTYKVYLKAKGLFRIVISNHSHRQFYHCKNFKMFYIYGFLIHSSIDHPSTCNKI